MYLAPGTLLPGGIEIGGRLGGGGHGTVYYARRGRAGEELALKVLNAPSPDTARRIVQEARILARLRHPNIVPLVEILEIAGHPAFLSAFAPAGSLADLLAQSRPALHEALALFRGVVAGVAHAHGQRIIHRDLKPANVLLTRSRDAGHVPWVADFGIARFLDATAHTAFAVGTPGFMAPEQESSPRDLDVRVDVFGLGCILHELVCGRPAFPRDRVGETLEAPPPELPSPVLAALHGCLALNREARITSCAELLAVLDGRARGGADRVSRVGATWAPEGREGGVRRAVLGAVVTAGVLALGGTALTASPSDDPASVDPAPVAPAPLDAPQCAMLTRLGVAPAGVDSACTTAPGFQRVTLTGPGADGACVAMQRALVGAGATLLEQRPAGEDLGSWYAWEGGGVTLLCGAGTVEVEAATEPIGLARP